MNDVVAALPAPADRWRPSRAGLVNLWRYWDETFTFHRGRLLLRGPNGSGKSLALELLLPFLLDADASPARLSSATRSRGGLFDRVMTGTDEATRTGFAWVEFVRGEEVFTVGARIRASQSTRKAEVDFFTTTLSVGRDLHLLDATRTPLSRKALAEAIARSGRVHGSGEDHRGAVREVLFPDFNADRYASVIGALLALRKEKLSQNLDLDKLSAVLSDALPPLDDHDIAVVAEGFERLDRRRAELADLEAELGEVRQLALRQREYARAVIVAVAGEVRSAETERDDVTRAERQAREELEGAQAEARAAAAERVRIEERDEAIGVEIDALKDSDAYREGAALADLRAQASRLRELAARAERTAQERADAHTRTGAELDEAAGLLAMASANHDQARRELHGAAEVVGGAGAVAEAEAIDDPDDAERLVRAWLRARDDRIEAVRGAIDSYERCLARRELLEERVAADELALTELAAAHAIAVGELGIARDRYRAAVEEWAGGCLTLGPGRVATMLAGRTDDPTGVAAAVGKLDAEARTADAVARRDLAAEREAVRLEREGLLAERSRWAEAGLPDPEGPPWRTDRTGRTGAPLWRLVDVAPGVAGADLDGLEAALSGAGLLDAWVEPDGAVDLGPGRVDLVLTVRPVPGETLASALLPAVATGEPPVPPEVVGAVLSSVAVVGTALPVAGGAGGESAGPDSPEVAIARDGSYRLGNAIGRGPDRPARLLGAPARERHRLERLAELDAALADLDSRFYQIRSREAALDRTLAATEAELGAVPSAEGVEEAGREVADAAARRGAAEAGLSRSRSELRDAEDEVRKALRHLTGLGARHGVPTDREGLGVLEAALSRLADAAAAWARRRRELGFAEREHRRSAERASRTREEAARAAEEYADIEREAESVQGRVAALESSIGAEYAAVVERIGRLEDERTSARRREKELAQAVPALERRVGELSTRVEAAASARAEAESKRERAQRRLVAASDDVGSDANVRPEGTLDTASSVLAFARALAVEHGGVDSRPQTVERLSERVRERVHQAQTALGARVEVERELAEEGWWVLRTNVGGIRRPAAELADSLAGELAQGRAELAAEEERLFEQTLAGSVRRALADRIRQANQLVDHINDQLSAIRTAAGGVEVRLRWQVDPDQLDAVKAARSLLLRDPADLSEEERASLQDFVRARVDQARAELEANAPWEARLRETLDYRAWHRFTLQLAHRDWEGFQPATPRRLQKLSTGERSIALHLPMIASVAAHYTGDGGRPSGCPRLILLDELFAGVDSANRAQLFGTFTAWDLDAVLTSDHEWCQYATLDGIAIHHLHHPTGAEPVTSTRFTWDGRQRRVDPTAA